MKSFATPVAALIVSLLVGCQSASWSTALKSKFSRDKSTSNVNDEPADDFRLVSKDKLNDAGRYRGRQSNGDTRVAGQGAGQAKLQDIMKLGHDAQQAGQLNQAKMFYQQALDIDSRNPLAHHKLAIIADQQAEFQRAEEHYLSALSVNRNDPNLLSDLGYSFLLQSRYDESKYYLQKALEAKPTHVRALNNLGLLHAKQGNYDGALAMFRQTGSEQKVQSKMQELFPNGPPQNRGPAAGQGTSLAFGQQQMPQVTPANAPADWENGGIQVTGGTQPASAPPFRQEEIRPNPASLPFPDDLNTQQSESEATIDFRNRTLPQPQRPDPRLADMSNQPGVPQPNSRQLPTNPLAGIPEFPSPDRQQSVPFPPESATPSSRIEESSQVAADQFQDAAGQVRNVSASVANNQPFDSNTHPSVNAAPPVVRPRYHDDPRQQAAMMGLNAGGGGIFPVMHNDPHAQPAIQPGTAPSVVPQNQSRQIDTNPAPFDNRAPVGRQLPITAAGQFQPGYSSQPQQPYAPAVGSDPRYRTAARPVTQPTITPQAQQPAAPAQPYQQPAARQYQPSPQYNTQQQPPAAPTQYTPQQQPAYNTQPSPGTQPLPQQYRPATVTPRAAVPFNPGNTYQRQ